MCRSNVFLTSKWKVENPLHLPSTLKKKQHQNLFISEDAEFNNPTPVEFQETELDFRFSTDLENFKDDFSLDDEASVYQEEDEEFYKELDDLIEELQIVIAEGSNFVDFHIQQTSNDFSKVPLLTPEFYDDAQFALKTLLATSTGFTLICLELSSLVLPCVISYGFVPEDFINDVPEPPKPPEPPPFSSKRTMNEINNC